MKLRQAEKGLIMEAEDESLGTYTKLISDEMAQNLIGNESFGAAQLYDLMKDIFQTKPESIEPKFADDRHLMNFSITYCLPSIEQNKFIIQLERRDTAPVKELET